MATVVQVSAPPAPAPPDVPNPCVTLKLDPLENLVHLRIEPLQKTLVELRDYAKSLNDRQLKMWRTELDQQINAVRQEMGVRVAEAVSEMEDAMAKHEGETNSAMQGLETRFSDLSRNFASFSERTDAKLKATSDLVESLASTTPQQRGRSVHHGSSLAALGAEEDDAQGQTPMRLKTPPGGGQGRPPSGDPHVKRAASSRAPAFDPNVLRDLAKAEDLRSAEEKLKGIRGEMDLFTQQLEKVSQRLDRSAEKLDNRIRGVSDAGEAQAGICATEHRRLAELVQIIEALRQEIAAAPAGAGLLEASATSLSGLTAPGAPSAPPTPGSAPSTPGIARAFSMSAGSKGGTATLLGIAECAKADTGNGDNDNAGNGSVPEGANQVNEELVAKLAGLEQAVGGLDEEAKLVNAAIEELQRSMLAAPWVEQAARHAALLKDLETNTDRRCDGLSDECNNLSRRASEIEGRLLDVEATTDGLANKDHLTKLQDTVSALELDLKDREQAVLFGARCLSCNRVYDEVQKDAGSVSLHADKQRAQLFAEVQRALHSGKANPGLVNLLAVRVGRKGGETIGGGFGHVETRSGARVARGVEDMELLPYRGPTAPISEAMAPAPPPSAETGPPTSGRPLAAELRTPRRRRPAPHLVAGDGDKKSGALPEFRQPLSSLVGRGGLPGSAGAATM